MDYYATELAYKRGYADGYEEGRISGTGLRPCLVDEKPAIFHRWVDEDKALLQSHALLRLEDHMKLVRLFREEDVVSPSATIEKLRTCFALVEYPDGSVGKVKPELVTFLDRKEG